MSTFRCEFEITGDLVLPKAIDKLELETTDAVITLRNSKSNDEGHAVSMIAVVIGPSKSIDSAHKELRDVLSEQLDFLAFATHSRFKIERPIRAVEWDAHLKKRKFRAYHTVDSRYPPEPGFSGGYLETVKALDRSAPPAFTRAALKYFRYGLLDPQPEDQFMWFWLSLEIIAENVKDRKKLPIACPVCVKPLTCTSCGTSPERMPMAKQEIERLIAAITGPRASGVMRRQFIARNGLMHGRSTSSIEKDCRMPMERIVNEIAAVAWHAIMSTIPIGDGPPLNFGHREGQFTNLTLVASAVGEMSHDGPEPHPEEHNLPTVNISLLTRFGGEDDQDDGEAR